jgi:hypothetical protein
MRGFGRWSLILELPNPLTPPSPLWGEGDRDYRLVVTFLLTCVSITVTSSSSLIEGDVPALDG